MEPLKKAAKFVVFFFGCIAIALLLLSFTDIPYYAYHDLGVMEDDSLSGPPENIIVMGGDGMPAPSALIRLYYAAQVAKKYTDAQIILALPMNGENNFHQLDLMKKELLIKGIKEQRIIYEPNGFNTRSQAVQTSELLRGELNDGLMIITSPEHMFRSVKVFEKVGFTNVGGLPAFEKPSDAITLKDNLKTEDPRIKNLSLRYNMWSYLHYELLVLREYAAISYYWLKGWI